LKIVCSCWTCSGMPGSATASSRVLGTTLFTGQNKVEKPVSLRDWCKCKCEIELIFYWCLINSLLRIPVLFWPWTHIFDSLKGLSHEIDFINFDQTLKNLT
jgi:hypothetical protein